MTIQKKVVEYSNKWLYNDIEVEELPSGVIGFVYCITNTLDGKFYIGKKNGFFLKTRIVKKKKKRIKVPSDWMAYYGSSEHLQEDIVKFGKDNFKREILVFCKTKAEMTYYEAKFQFDCDVLLSENNYNAWIMCRIRKSHLKGLNNV